MRIVRDAIAAAAESGDARIVTLPDNVPWKQVVVTEAPEALLVIYPKRQGFGVGRYPSRSAPSTTVSISRPSGRA